ncbi:MAG: murein L,D-transpeptidase catalytic domain family protein [Pseudobdellovibrionaceae bacterium]
MDLINAQKTSTTRSALILFVSVLSIFITNKTFAMSPVKNAPQETPSAPTTPPEVSDPEQENQSGVDWRNYDHLDPDHVVPTTALQKAVAYFDANQSKIKNKNYMIVLDFSRHSGKKRFYIINMKTGAVESFKTAHGKYSDPDHDGYATSFSNTNGSGKSSIGFYLTAETYYGANGYSLKLDGLSSTNSNARSRAVVIHPANYVSENSSKQGRSLGCPALDPKHSEKIIEKIKRGSLIYAFNKL